jgi:predicted ATP-dependent serine protease
VKCNLCSTEIPTGKIKCLSCGTINIGGISQTPIANFNDGSVLLSDVVSADEKRLDVGPFNRIFGGPILNPEEVENDEPEINGPGLVEDSVCLIAGTPGAGKSTFSLHLIDYIINKIGGEALIIAAEESLPQIKARAIRIKIKNLNKIRMVGAMTGGVDLGAILVTRNPKITIIDSLAGLVGEDDAASVEICKISKQYAEKLHCPIIITQHVTKGEEVAGVNTIQHDVDTVMIFRPYIEDGDLRELEVDPKNRFGRAFIKMYMLMSDKGLEPLPNDFDPENLVEDDK